jgi:hypothetical protein
MKKCVCQWWPPLTQTCKGLILLLKHRCTWWNSILILLIICFSIRHNFIDGKSGIVFGLSTYYFTFYKKVFFFSFSGWGETESTWYVGHCWPIVPAPDDRWWWYGAVGGMRIGRGNRSTTPVPLCPPQIPLDLGSNPGRRGGKPATNRLSYGTALKNVTLQTCIYFQTFITENFSILYFMSWSPV